MLPFYEPFFADILGLGQYAYKLIILLFVASAVCFSRMYLGVHSADQIVLGAFLGIAFLVLYRYCAQKELYRIFSCLIHNYNRCFNWSCTIIAEILCLLLPIIFFLLNSNNRPMEPIYLVGLNEVCSTRYTSV